MVEVLFIIDILKPGSESRRAELAATLPGVPAAGDAVWVAKTYALTVHSVSWRIHEQNVMIFLTRADSNPQSVIAHDYELELPDHWVDALIQAGWMIEE